MCWACENDNQDECWDDISPARKKSTAQFRKVHDTMIKRIRQARQSVEIQRRLDIADAFGSVDHFTDGQVITFALAFGDNGRLYRYAAMRSNGRWWLTGGRACQGVSWSELVEWWVSQDSPVTPGRVTVLIGDMISLSVVLDAKRGNP